MGQKFREITEEHPKLVGASFGVLGVVLVGINVMSIVGGEFNPIFTIVGLIGGIAAAAMGVLLIVKGVS